MIYRQRMLRMFQSAESVHVQGVSEEVQPSAEAVILRLRRYDASSASHDVRTSIPTRCGVDLRKRPC